MENKVKTVGEFRDALPGIVIRAMKAQLIGKLGKDLENKLLAEGADLHVNVVSGTYSILNCSPQLEKEINLKLVG
ncbi:hypothetical protein FO440_14665 [Mucilaginibacter corticis]|uniref:Uncharacterized protein n=1 Tax=Mucilaginibacter corticis TaxID=2597670 RepID=A0A556MM50_9SPHI|nr:hypothetical protein [Mucilaginibacter corticis]TSJ40973.1 hypothetical protein FO440_14665 [Mucilaginibacter corticis]